jgi:hypothetical protein
LSSNLANYFLRRYFNIGVLFAAAVLGVIYLFLIPPWQHNDEPTKFEFAWLLANRKDFPLIGDYDQGMRREVAASMIEHGFFKDWFSQPNLISVHEPIWIGISQINDEPLYYYLASLPLRIFRYTDITFQLYSARFISLILYLFTVWIVLLASKDLFSEAHPLAKIVPLFVAFLPGFVGLMTAVNDDVGAVAFLTLFFYASIRVLKGGLNLSNLAILIASILLCVFTKRTAWLALPFGILVIFLAIFRYKIKTAAMGAGVLSAVGLVAVISWSYTSPAAFYSPSNRSLPVRASIPEAPAGRHVFTNNSGPHNFYQALGTSASNLLAGESVTLGMWAWSSEPVVIDYPQLRANGSDIIQGGRINLSTQPTFYSFTGYVPPDASWLVLSVSPGVNPKSQKIYFDCLVLARGEYSPEIIPSPYDPNCSRINWGEHLVENKIRNASAERAWPVLRENIAGVMDRRFSFSISNLWGVIDPQATWYYFYETSAHLFRTFWGKFGWGNVSLLGQKPYRIFLVLTILGISGWMLAVRKDRPRLNYPIILFLVLAALFQIFMALFRAGGNWYNYIFTPTARYAYPSLFPIAVVLVIGWWNLIHLKWRSESNQTLFVSMFFLFFVFLNIWAVISITRFFY